MGELYKYQEKTEGDRKIYHVKFFSCKPEDRSKIPEIMKQFKPREGVEPIGLFFPRGSNYMFATVAKYKDYATWEKYWADILKERQKGMTIITEEKDMFFEEIKL